MPRIRTVKPDFFRDETLQDLEVSHSDLKPMLTFEALWCHSDKSGNFLWNPRVLHLDILPFIQFDLGASLVLLSEAGLLSPYDGADGKKYGHIHNFSKHQRINGKEAQEPAKFPEYQTGSIGEVYEKHPVALGREGNKEMEMEGKGIPQFQPSHESMNLDMAVSFVLVETGLAGKKIRDVIHEVIHREIKKVGVDPKDCAEAMIDTWRRYDCADIAYKQGPENFFGTGTWRKSEKEWERNGNGKPVGKAELAVEQALANCAAAKRAIGLDH
jgi:hypothetical protein